MNLKTLLSGTLVAFVAAANTNANAATISAGYDYLVTNPGTYFDFGGPIGIVNFQGYAIGPGNTDTIVQRLSPTTINGPATNIQIIALSLVSTAPVPAFGGNPIYVTLAPGNLAQDTGTITINGSQSGGTFDSFFDVFFDICLTPGPNGVGCGGPALLPVIQKTFTSNGSPWSATPPPYAANPNGDFFPGLITHSTDGGQHVVSVAQTPLPATLPLFVTGLGALGLLAWRRKRSGANVARMGR